VIEVDDTQIRTPAIPNVLAKQVGVRRRGRMARIAFSDLLLNDDGFLDRGKVARDDGRTPTAAVPALRGGVAVDYFADYIGGYKLRHLHTWPWAVDASWRR
jgi:hypothetical protein